MEFGIAIASLDYLPSISRLRMEERITGGGVSPTLRSGHQAPSRELTVCLVHTCQKPSPKRCDFFLWDDDAKPREAAVVLNNSRSEPRPEPQTPQKQHAGTSLQTPNSNEWKPKFVYDQASPSTPSKPSIAPRPSTHDTQLSNNGTTQSDEEVYDWPSSEDDEIVNAADLASMPPPETPRKAAKTNTLSTPGKRRHDEMEIGTTAWPTPTTGSRDEDVFMTPSTGMRSGNLFGSNGRIPPPTDTPTPQRFRDAVGVPQASQLFEDIFQSLQRTNVPLGADAREAIQELCEKQTKYTKGVVKGRDISRATIARKDEKIAELQGDIAGLKADRETERTIIRHLKRELERANRRRDS